MLVRWCNGEVLKTQRRVKWEILRCCSVDELIRFWGASISDLDQITDIYLKAEDYRSTNRQHNKGGGKKDMEAITHLFQQLRLHRFHNKST